MSTTTKPQVPTMNVLGYGRWEGSERPPAAILPPRTRGRSSQLGRICAEVLGQACGPCIGSLSQTPFIFASAYGEMGTTIELLELMGIGDGELSPAKFQKSVHNTSTASISLAHGNKRSSTAIASGEHTLAMALVEAWAQLSVNGGEVLVVIAEEKLPSIFGVDQGDSYAIGLRLSFESLGEIHARLGQPRCSSDALRNVLRNDQGPNETRHPSDYACELVDRVTNSKLHAESVFLELGPHNCGSDQLWSIEVSGAR